MYILNFIQVHYLYFCTFLDQVKGLGLKDCLSIHQECMCCDHIIHMSVRYFGHSADHNIHLYALVKEPLTLFHISHLL